MTIGTATGAGFRECVETDAYWLSMRTKQVCGSYGDLRLEDVVRAPVRELSRKLADHGVRVWAWLDLFRLASLNLACRAADGR